MVNRRSEKEISKITDLINKVKPKEPPMHFTIKSKGLTLEEALNIHRHEKRRLRRKGEEPWCLVLDDKIIRDGAGIRGIRLEDAIAKDWEVESLYRNLSADEIQDAMLTAIRGAERRTLSPMELLNIALTELGLR